MHFMRTLCEELGAHCDIVTLYENDTAVSGALIAWFNGTMYVPFVSSRFASFTKRVNLPAVLANHGNRHRERLRGVFDFGTSMQGASTLEFKQQWGTTLVAGHLVLLQRKRRATDGCANQCRHQAVHARVESHAARHRRSPRTVDHSLDSVTISADMP